MKRLSTHLGPALAVLAAVALLTIAAPSWAFRAEQASLALEITPAPEQYQFVYLEADLAAIPGVAVYAELLERELGPGWRVSSWNQYSGTARSVSGAGVMVAPEGLASATELEIESLARTFIEEHAALFATDGTNLEVVKIAHGLNRWGVIFEQVLDGIPVQDTQVVLALHDNGRLFAFGSSIYPDASVQTTPAMDLAGAREIARSSVPYARMADYPEGPDALVILPVHRGPADVDYLLAHRTDVPVPEPLGIYRTWVDAHTGEILLRDNQIEFAYEGSTAGDVEIFSPCDGDTPNSIMGKMTVEIDGVGSVDSDDDGNFSIPGNSGPHSYSAEFDGPGFNVNCSGCGGDGVITGTIEPDSHELIYFDLQTFRADERDAFHFCNFIKHWTELIDPEFTQSKYTVNVNVPGCCNANWSPGVMNFYAEGCGCENMARVSDVVVHEFGHGIQHWALGGGQGPQGLGEGNADITSTFTTDNPIVGIGVVDCTSGARYCDNELVYPDDLNGQIHHDGQIICGFNWDVRTNLEPKLGFEGAKAHTSALWLFARKLFMNSSNIQPDQAERYIWVDDDNGNLFDGTPNLSEICAAKVKHGYGDCPTGAPTDVDDVTPVASAIARLLDASPNPFGSATSIRYSLAGEAAVELSVYDPAGRLIRTIENGTRSGGLHVVGWDGTSDEGTVVASGTYFYRLQVGDWEETRAVVLLK